MKNSTDILNNIQRVEVPEYLYDTILHRIQEKQNNTVRPVWISAAAAVFVILFVAQIVLMFQQNRSFQQENIVNIPNNMLYDE